LAQPAKAAICTTACHEDSCVGACPPRSVLLTVQCCNERSSERSSAERLAFSCEDPRERSDRGLRQLQRPSYAAPAFDGCPIFDPHDSRRPLFSGTAEDSPFESGSKDSLLAGSELCQSHESQMRSPMSRQAQRRLTCSYPQVRPAPQSALRRHSSALEWQKKPSMSPQGCVLLTPHG
jgi:hypothetical protein